MSTIIVPGLKTINILPNTDGISVVGVFDTSSIDLSGINFNPAALTQLLKDLATYLPAILADIVGTFALHSFTMAPHNSNDGAVTMNLALGTSSGFSIVSFIKLIEDLSKALPILIADIQAVFGNVPPVPPVLPPTPPGK